MAIAADTTSPPEPGYRRPRGTLLALRLVAGPHAVLALLQPVFAGIYLTGDFDALAWHGLINGHLVQLLGIIQLVVAIFFVTLGRGRFVPLTASILIFLGEGMQVGMGYSRELAIHIPLGVAIVAGQLLFALWVFGPHARRGRQLKSTKASTP